ncbi:MAG: polyamine ABC transporter substrate-binding protein [Proteobacteria bacterium]|nr:polyamine ABC transporter substrate-binding protein [Pseudomonadota bacterium]
MQMNRFLGVALAALGIAGLATDAAAQKKTVVVGMASADAGRLDPHLSATTPDKALMYWMFNGLVRIQPGRASPEFIEPDLAESWTSTADRREWVFTLRHGVQCHHGFGELTAADVVYSLQRAGDAKRSSFSADFASFDKVEALDPYKVKITLKSPIPSLLGVLTNYHGGNIVCKKAAEEMGENFPKRPIGTGPFMFAEYQPQQFVRLVANKAYFRGAPQIEQVTYRYIPSDASRDLAFQSGEVDMIYGRQDEAWATRIKQVPGTVVSVMEPGEMSVLSLNMKSKPLDDIRVRRAFAHAIDRKAMVEFRGALATRASYSVVPEGYLGFSRDVPTPEFNIAKAKQLLAEAGYKDGVTIKAIHTTLPGMLSTIEAAQAHLRKAGINLQIEPVEHATFHAQIRKDLSQVVHYAAARFPVADVYLTQFFHSRSIVNTPTAVTNFSHCDVADQEIDAARVEADPAKQKELWKQAQVKIMEAVCGVPIYEALQLWAWKDSLDLGYQVVGSLNLGPPITEKARFTR